MKRLSTTIITYAAAAALLQISAQAIAQPTEPTQLSPLSGSFEDPPTFHFHVNTTGCYVIVVSDEPTSCTATALDWVYSLGAVSAGTDKTITIPQSDWDRLNVGTIYWHISYRLTAPCEPPYPYYSTCVPITKSNPSTVPGSRDKHGRDYVQLAPNPASENVHVTIGTLNAADIGITILDVLGRNVGVPTQRSRDSQFQTADFAVYDLPRGLYFVRVMLDGTPFVCPLVIVR